MSADARESTGISATSAASVHDETEVAENLQSSPTEDFFISDSQTSPNCSAVLRNKVKLFRHFGWPSQLLFVVNFIVRLSYNSSFVCLSVAYGLEI